MCRVLNVARSGYYAWRPRGESPREEEDRRLEADIQRLYEHPRVATVRHV
jgi:putative transposase